MSEDNLRPTEGEVRDGIRPEVEVDSDRGEAERPLEGETPDDTSSVSESESDGETSSMLATHPIIVRSMVSEIGQQLITTEDQLDHSPKTTSKTYMKTAGGIATIRTLCPMMKPNRPG